MIEQLEINLHWFAREIPFKAQHALLVIESRLLRQLRGDDGRCGKIDILPGEVREGFGKTSGSVGFAEARCADVAQYCEIL